MSAGFANINVLIVEDEKELREILNDRLIEEFQGIQISVAEDVDSAKMVLTHSSRIDLIISDFRMPGGTGKDLLSYLEEANLRIPTIIYSGGGYDNTCSDHPNCLGIVHKPQLPELASVVRSQLSQINQEQVA